MTITQLQQWSTSNVKQITLLIRAINFKAGLQQYTTVYITSLEGIAALCNILKKEFKDEFVYSGVSVLEGEHEYKGI